MPLDPGVRAFLDQLAAEGGPPLESLPLAEARTAALALRGMQRAPEPVARIEDRRIEGPGGVLAVRIYTPDVACSPLPALVFFHGGGWALWNLDTHDGVCCGLARRIPAVVVSVDYRLAPEHRFPAAAEDAYAATRWVAAHAAALGAGASRLAVAGDSAGGNLAAVTALMARDRGGPALAHQALIYPATDACLESASHRENAEGYLLTRATMAWFWQHYLRGPEDRGEAYASPLRAPDLRGLPPAFVLTAEFDPLRDEGEAYAERLRAAAVAATTRRFDGMIHGFLTLSGVIPQAMSALDEVAAAVRASL